MERTTITITVSADELEALNRYMGTRLMMFATEIDEKNIADIILARVHQVALKATMKMDLTK